MVSLDDSVYVIHRGHLGITSIAAPFPKDALRGHLTLFSEVRGRVILRSWLLLEPELLRSEGLAEAFPGRLDELGRAHDPFDLGLGAVSPYVVLSEYLPKGHIPLHAGDDVIGDL